MELDLRIAHLPAASIDYLREAMLTMGAGAENNGSSTTGNGKEGVEQEKEFDYERRIFSRSTLYSLFVLRT